MKILFVFSGNSDNGVSPIVSNQMFSIINEGISISVFPIIGKGFWGYLKNILPLKKRLKKEKVDITHAHYSLSSFIASLAGAKPLVVSLMGSDVKVNKWNRLILRLFNHFFWDYCIVKTEEMRTCLKSQNIAVIPNGVDLNKFKPFDKVASQKKLNWNIEKKHILFAANPEITLKNYKLAKQSFEQINQDDLEMHVLGDVPNDLMPFYYNASDVVLLTSFTEGSPNVIKEAMACNCPIVSTQVGDVYTNMKNLDGCYITTHDAKDVVNKLGIAIKFRQSTHGRDRIIQLGLDTKTIARKITEIYEKVLS